MLKLIEKWDGFRIYKYNNRTFNLSWYGRGKGNGWKCTEEDNSGTETKHYPVDIIQSNNIQEAVTYLKIYLGIK